MAELISAGQRRLLSEVAAMLLLGEPGAVDFKAVRLSKSLVDGGGLRQHPIRRAALISSKYLRDDDDGNVTLTAKGARMTNWSLVKRLLAQRGDVRND